MDRQIPRGSPDLKCPFWQKSMDKVCHTCPMWQKVMGKNPQTREEIDRWDCSIAWLPMLLLENAQRQIQTAASVDKVANEIQAGGARHYEAVSLMMSLANRLVDRPATLENGEHKLLE